MNRSQPPARLPLKLSLSQDQPVVRPDGKVVYHRLPEGSSEPLQAYSVRWRRRVP